MISFDDLISKGHYELRYNIPVELLTKQMGYSLVQFCRDSSILKESITISPFPDAYFSVIASVTTPGIISSVSNVNVYGKNLSKSLYSFNEVYSELWIDSSVGAPGQDVEVEAIAVPSAEYRDYPESFYAAYGPGIVAHACFELSADESEPWARTARIPIFKKAYDDAVSQARRRNYKPFRLMV